MIQHVTLYVLKEVERLPFVKEQLEKLKECNLIMDNKVVVSCQTDLPSIENPLFAQIAHLATFKDEKDAQAFPMSKEHMELVQTTNDCINQVITMNYIDE